MYKGSVIDNEGKLNNFAIEPEVYVQEAVEVGFTPQAEVLNGRFSNDRICLPAATRGGYRARLSWLHHQPIDLTNLS